MPYGFRINCFELTWPSGRHPVPRGCGTTLNPGRVRGRSRDPRLVPFVHEHVSAIHDRQTVALARKPMGRRPRRSPEAHARGTFVSAEPPGSNEDMMLFWLPRATDAGHAGDIVLARRQIPRLIAPPPAYHRTRRSPEIRTGAGLDGRRISVGNMSSAKRGCPRILPWAKSLEGVVRLGKQLPRSALGGSWPSGTR